MKILRQTGEPEMEVANKDQQIGQKIEITVFVAQIFLWKDDYQVCFIMLGNGMVMVET